MSIRNILLAEGEYYHVYNRGVERRVLFLDNGDKERFVRLLYSANSSTSIYLSDYQGKALAEIPKGENIVAIGAWCLMPNHFHILLKEIKTDGISMFMQKLLTGYSMYFNKKYHRKGSLFEGKFSAKHLDYDQYLKYQFTYIHLNPIGIIDKEWKEKKLFDKKVARKFLKDYKYSSYGDYAGEKREEGLILSKKEFPEYFCGMTDFEDMITEWINFDTVEPE